MNEYNLPFFKENQYQRKLCPNCKEYFWTQDPSQITCGEATPEDCGRYTFIGNPPTKKSYDLNQMREAFLSYFERKGHKRIKPYPVVARWRDDIYLTNASIIDFQPYVTEGIAPPPANPLVIVQPCIRLLDIANTGPTFGRHLTIFEMGGAHAFNYSDKEVYWKDQTVRYHHDWVTRDLGVGSDEIVYKEGVWIGGGNAGPDLECIIRGLEVATLVFMQFKVVGDEFIKLPIQTVDTGYGIDRYTWLSQGAPSGFHAVYGNLIEKIMKMAGISSVDNDRLVEIAKVSGIVSLDKSVSRLATRKREAELTEMNLDELDSFLSPIENAFAIADHTKCLSFVLSEGVVPSNIQEGYLARLVFRRTYRLLKMLGISNRLYEIMDAQIDRWSREYSHIKEMQNEIMEMLKVEEEKFEDTIRRGEALVKRISTEMKTKKKKVIQNEALAELYDSHGLPPEMVKQVAEEEGVLVEVPENFYTLVAQRHMQASEEKIAATRKESLEDAVSGLPETQLLYYQDQYVREFKAKTLKILKNEFVVLDKTCFFPEGGGQPADSGYLIFDNMKIEVVDVQKIGKVVVHRIKGKPPNAKTSVRGIIDWPKRHSLMKNHTATHVIGGAAKRVLGEHVWQFGTQKGVESSRLDISHYRRLSLEETQRIEQLANEAILRNIPVETAWMPRSEAERLYGFRLYQGGAVPGKEIRVVKTGDWDVEACAGTHLRNTGELGFIKIIHSERIQDGVERITYSVGIPALRAIQERERLLWKVADTIKAPIEKLDTTAERIVQDLKEANIKQRKLVRQLAEIESTATAYKTREEIQEIDGIKLVKRDFMDEINVDRMVQTAQKMVTKDETVVALFHGSDGHNARILAMAGDKAIEKGIDASEIVREASAVIGGGGGGRPNFAQGGGTHTTKLQTALKRAESVARKQLKLGPARK